MKKYSLLFFCASLLLGCDEVDSSDKKQNRQQESLNMQAIMSVGMPSIINFQEKRNLKMILELRDNENLATITYTQDMNGKLHKLCDSIGYGMPYATQYTSPSRYARRHETEETDNAIIHQADPNGLYSPSS